MNEIVVRDAVMSIIKDTLDNHWTSEKAAIGVTMDEAEQAITLARRGMLPLAETEPMLDGPLSRSLVNALGDIGCKIAPTMAEEHGKSWRVAMLKALSDLPGKVAVGAAKQAMNVPMRFINEVELTVREKAEGLLSQQRVSLWRLEALIAEIERAASPPQPQIAYATQEKLSNAEIRALSKPFLDMALGQGWLAQEDINAAYAEAGKPIPEV